MPRRMPAAERDALYAKVVQLRRAKTPWDQIGKQIGKSPSRSHEIYQEALAHNPLTSVQIDEHRIEALEEIDLAIRSLMVIATNAATRPGTKVEAWSSARAWHAERNKITGVYAPTQHQITTIDMLDRQIMTLEAELGAQADVLEGGGHVLDAEIAHLETQLAGGDPATTAVPPPGTPG